MLVGIGENESWSGDEFNTWSGEESEDAEDLAELEARLYSQYHYQEDFLGENASSTSMIKDDQSTSKYEDNLQDNEDSKCDISLPVESIEKTGNPNFKDTGNSARPNRLKNNERPKQMIRNPLYTQTSDGESSGSDTSEDEGIIAVNSGDDSDHSSSISFETLISQDAAKIEKDQSRARLLLDSYKKAKEIEKFTDKTNDRKKEHFVANYDSDISEFIDSDFEILSDDEYNMKLNIKHHKDRLAIRVEELQELNRKTSLVPDKWNTEMNHFYTHIEAKNLSITTADLLKDTAGSGGKWELDLADIYKTSNNKRYFFSRGRCTNCSQPGHTVRQCPEPRKKVRCSMCGLVGHRDQRCPGSCCLGCGNPDNFFRSICPQCKFMDNVVCKECGYQGHKKQRCPDLWRRFHNTVPNVQFIDADSGGKPASAPLEPRNNNSHKKKSDQWCCNCGRRGHLVDGCRRRQYSEYPVRPVKVQNYSPVLKLDQQYDEQKPKSKKKKEKKRKQNFQPDSQLPPPKKKRKTNHDDYLDESFSNRKWGETFTKNMLNKQPTSSWLRSLTRSQSPTSAKKRAPKDAIGKVLSKKQQEKKEKQHEKKEKRKEKRREKQKDKKQKQWEKNLNKVFQGHFASQDDPEIKPKSNNKKQKRFNLKNSKKDHGTSPNQQNPYLQKFEERKAKASKKRIKAVFKNPQLRFATNGDMSLKKNSHKIFT